MWRTTSTSAQLTSNFVGALEGTSIDDCRLVRFLAENYSHRVLGLLQHYRSFSEVGDGIAKVCFAPIDGPPQSGPSGPKGPTAGKRLRAPVDKH